MNINTCATEPTYTQQLEQLRLFVNSENPMMLILGDKGSGKTTLLNEIINQFKNSREVLHLHADKHNKPRELLQVLCDHGVSNTPDKHLKFEHQLEHILSDLKSHGKNFLLVIDNAHLLQYSVLAAISHLALLQEKQKIFLHILLSGHADLQEKAASIQTRPIPFVKLSILNNNVARKSFASIMKETKRGSLIKKIKDAFKPSSHDINTVNYSKHSQTTTFQIFWVHHQVKVLALAGLIVVFSGLKLFNFQKNTNPLKNTRIINTATIPAANNTLAQATGDYTIQLQQSHSKAKLKRIIKHNHLENRAFISAQTNKSHPTYTLNIGHYPSKKQAAAAAKHLPKSLNKHHPSITQSHA